MRTDTLWLCINDIVFGKNITLLHCRLSFLLYIARGFTWLGCCSITMIGTCGQWVFYLGTWLHMTFLLDCLRYNFYIQAMCISRYPEVGSGISRLYINSMLCSWKLIKLPYEKREKFLFDMGKVEASLFDTENFQLLYLTRLLYQLNVMLLKINKASLRKKRKISIWHG